MNAPVTLAIVGAGKRGEAYAAYAGQHPDQLKVVAGGRTAGTPPLQNG